MSWIPIDFVNDTEPFIEADNLNHIQQGIVIALNKAETVEDAYNRGELKGDKGDRGDRGIQGESGLQGVQGLQGIQGIKGDKGDKGDKGVEGKNFTVDGWVGTVANLPDPTLNQGKTFGTQQFGHLHHSNGVNWIDWGEFTGVQGEKGDKGEKGDNGDRGERGLQGVQGIQGVKGDKGDKGDQVSIENLTESQLRQLHEKLTPFNEHQTWSYQTYLSIGQNAQFKIADLNLDFYVKRDTTAVMNYKVFPHDVEEPAFYYINRLTNYDAIAWESTYTSSWKAQAITASGFVLDASAYLAGREQTHILIIDPNTNMQYSLMFTGLYEGTMFIDVTKKVNSKRQIITPMT